MTSQPLPERAHIEHLKKQAKALLQSARAQDPAALQRFHALPAFAGQPLVSLDAARLALHDAQSVIAREYGFASWKELSAQVEEQSLTFAAALEEFVRCATGNVRDRAMRLLGRFPSIAHANVYAELVLGDAEAVTARLEAQPDLVTKTGGVQQWEPLLYVCHTCLAHESPERAQGLVATARALLQRGANPNAEYHWNWHPELPRTALWGALCAVRSLPLAEILLEAGANPTDGVSTHITAGGGDLASLELLARYGVNVDGIPGGVPPLRYLLSWANTPVGAQWLLEHGADPNLTWGENGSAPIHVAAERWDVAMVEMLVRHGADLNQRRTDGATAHTLAELHGNREIAEWLLAHGATDERTLLERFVSVCARGDRPSAEALLHSHPELRGQLTKTHHLMMHVPAERGDAAVLETMLECGFDPNVRDHDGVTALHRAAMAGRVDAARVLLAHGASVHALDVMFAAPPLVWAAEGWTHAPTPEGFVEVARVLIDAGSPLEWVAPEKAPDPESTVERLAELCAAAGAEAG